MRQQRTFAQAEYAAKKKVTRRDQFLGDLQRHVPWSALHALIKPHDYVEGRRSPGAPADRAGADSAHVSAAAGVRLGRRGGGGGDLRQHGVCQLPRERVGARSHDAVGVSPLLEANELQKPILETVNAVLCAQGLMMQGTVVDASIIAAPSSTKNKDKAHDPEMHQTRKSNQWYFGMKAHIGVDLHCGLVHSVAGSAADVTQTVHLPHGAEKKVFADAGYIDADKRVELTGREVTWHIARKRATVNAMDEGPLKELTRQAERLKARLRARVEHPFHIVKNRFAHRKVRYKGLKKNTGQLYVLFALANLVIAKRALLA